MKKFKVRYYEIELNENKNMYDKVIEKEIEANCFFINDGIVTFRKNDHENSNIAAFKDFISIEQY